MEYIDAAVSQYSVVNMEMTIVQTRYVYLIHLLLN